MDDKNMIDKIEPLKEFIEDVKADIKSRNPSLEDHYGAKKDTIFKFNRLMTADFFINDNISETLDKWFPDLDAEGRLKVFAFAIAYTTFKKAME